MKNQVVILVAEKECSPKPSTTGEKWESNLDGGGGGEKAGRGWMKNGWTERERETDMEIGEIDTKRKDGDRQRQI